MKVPCLSYIITNEFSVYLRSVSKKGVFLSSSMLKTLLPAVHLLFQQGALLFLPAMVHSGQMTAMIFPFVTDLGSVFTIAM